jgi:hypothetical protein
VDFILTEREQNSCDVLKQSRGCAQVATIMGLYPLISLNFFGRHSNGPSLAIPDWKNFLRMHIEQNGDLRIYPIGIRRVPRHWKERSMGKTGPELVADDPQATEPELIEPPIVMKKARAETGTGVKTTSESVEACTQP